MPHTVFTAEIPYPLMWGKSDWLLLRLEGKDYEIAFERAWRPGKSGNEIKFDRLGRVSYTKVAVRFPYATTHDDSEELIQVGHKAINRLLDVYRCATKESHIGHISIQELGPLNTSHGVYDLMEDGSVWERNSFSIRYGIWSEISPDARPRFQFQTRLGVRASSPSGGPFGAQCEEVNTLRGISRCCH